VLDSFPFDPLGQSSPSMELREIKNGRLAMVRPQTFLALVIVICVFITIPCNLFQQLHTGHWLGSCSPNTGRIPAEANVSLVQVAFVGFAVQALVTREQPIEGLSKHLADPFGHNIIT